MKKIILGLLLSTIMLNSCKQTNSEASLGELAADTTAVSVDTIISEPSINSWEYSEEVDKMTSKTIKFASIISNESLNLDSPYDGMNYGRLCVRKKEGLNIYVSVDKGQISGEYDNHYIMVRFDEEKAMRFDYNEPQDNSSDLIFIDNETKFLSKLKKSKKVLISLPFYQNGNQILEFNTSDLKW
jgi:hypothetical protein